MAKMFPPDGPCNAGLHGESKVYDLLSKLDDDLMIFIFFKIDIGFSKINIDAEQKEKRIFY